MSYQEIIFSLVPRDQLLKEYFNGIDFFERAAHSSNGRYAAEDLLKECWDNSMSLWICLGVNDGNFEILGLVFTSVIQYPRKKSLSIRYMSGIKLKFWWQSAYKILNSYAKDANCENIEAICRPGWLRYAQKLGITPNGHLFDWVV